jgi:hypothetical protein
MLVRSISKPSSDDRNAGDLFSGEVSAAEEWTSAVRYSRATMTNNPPIVGRSIPAVVSPSVTSRHMAHATRRMNISSSLKCERLIPRMCSETSHQCGRSPPGHYGKRWMNHRPAFRVNAPDRAERACWAARNGAAVAIDDAVLDAATSMITHRRHDGNLAPRQRRGDD